ncbi:MAG: hypothetical protein ACRDE7_05855 [Sphingobacterium sp.]
MKGEDFDKQIASMAKNHQVTPPSLVWDNIAQEIQKPQQKVQKKRFPFYASLSLAAAILIFMGLALHFFSLKDSKKEQKLTTHNPTSHHPMESTPKEQSLAMTPAEEGLSGSKFSQQIASESQPITTESRLKQVDKEPDELVSVQKKETGASMENRNKRVKIGPPNRAFAAQDIQLTVTSAINHETPRMEAGPTMEISYANDQEFEDRKKKPNLLILVLNTLTQNINPTQKDLSFDQDEEGTIQVDFSNTLVKN